MIAKLPLSETLKSYVDALGSWLQGGGMAISLQS